MGRFLDRIVLKPTQDPIEVEAEKRWIETCDFQIECFVSHEMRRSDCELIVLKFPGAAGRAENASVHPLDHWVDVSGVMAVANPPGFGNSPGPASLDSLVPAALAVFDEFAGAYPGVPILLVGSSLGATVAMCVAAQREGSAATALILRDPPDIRQVIWHRFGWPTGWLPARVAMRYVPTSLDGVAAAEACDLPGIFVSSGRDRVVPPIVQRSIIGAYAGPQRVIRLPEAGHYDAMSDNEVAAYRQALDWLRPQLVDNKELERM